MTSHNEKYVVLKREDWDKFAEHLPLISERGYTVDVPEEVLDAVVIRRQDHFAPAALNVYAHSISLVAKVLNEQGETATARRLQRVADYFHEQSELAMEEAHKLPD